jgi:hypothetical protein
MQNPALILTWPGPMQPRHLCHRLRYAHSPHSQNALFCRRQGRYSGAEAVLVAVPGGLVADVLGAVTGIESKAVIDGTSLSGAMSQDRLAFSSAHQGARRSQGPEIRERAGRAALKGARLARDYSSPV